MVSSCIICYHGCVFLTHIYCRSSSHQTREKYHWGRPTCSLCDLVSDSWTDQLCYRLDRPGIFGNPTAGLVHSMGVSTGRTPRCFFDDWYMYNAGIAGQSSHRKWNHVFSERVFSCTRNWYYDLVATIKLGAWKHTRESAMCCLPQNVSNFVFLS